LDNVIKTVFRLLLRAVLVLMGLVFFLSVLAVALLLMGLWLVRALWAWLTGQPRQPWAFQILRQAQWNRFYRAEGSTASGPSRVVDADVIDVESKQIHSGSHLPHDRADR
jgi:hypothetical protein